MQNSGHTCEGSGFVMGLADIYEASALCQAPGWTPARPGTHPHGLTVQGVHTSHYMPKSGHVTGVCVCAHTHAPLHEATLPSPGHSCTRIPACAWNPHVHPCPTHLCTRVSISLAYKNKLGACTSPLTLSGNN